MKQFSFLNLVCVFLVMLCADLLVYSGTDMELCAKMHGHATVLILVYFMAKVDSLQK